jgi:hemerythrin
MVSLLAPLADTCHVTAMPPELMHISQAQESLRQQADWLKTCPEECVPDAYHGLMRCAEQLFQLEQTLMEAYDFPSRRTHLELHARVLHGLHCVHGAVLNGECSQGRHTGGSLLLDWLALHQDTVDAVLAVWIDYCKQGPRDPSAPGQQGQIKAP